MLNGRLGENLSRLIDKGLRETQLPTYNLIQGSSYISIITIGHHPKDSTSE